MTFECEISRFISWRYTVADSESKKYPESSESRSKEGKVMAAHAQGGAMVIVLVLVVLTVFVTVSVLPISPSITVGFQIGTQQISYNQPYQATIILGSVQYQKVPFLSYYSSAHRDMLSLSNFTVQGGSYGLGASVSYGGTVLSVANYTMIGDGFYQLKVNYFPRTENPTTPYVVNIILYLQTSSPFSMTVNILPS